MSVVAARVSVATTATLLSVTAESDLYTGIASETYGQSFALRNRSAVSVFIGGSTVTTATGFEILAGEMFAVDLNPTDAMYGVVATGTAACHVLQAGV